MLDNVLVFIRDSRVILWYHQASDIFYLMEPETDNTEKPETLSESKYFTWRRHPAPKNTVKVNTSRSRGELKLLKEIIKDNAPKWT